MALQVWYFEDSPAAGIARKLPKGFSGRPTSRNYTFPARGVRPHVWLADYTADSKALRKMLRASNPARVVYLVPSTSRLPKAGQHAFLYLPKKGQAPVIAKALESAFETAKMAQQSASAENRLRRTSKEVKELNRIGIALSSEKDPDRMLNLILTASREITSSDAGSLYLVEEVSETEKRLRFKLTQNDSLSTGFTEFTMPISRSSIAGYVADTGEVLNIANAYKISEKSPFQFNQSFDRDTGYRTKSMLTIPLKNPKGEILGVLQLINCKENFRKKLTTPKEFESGTVAYTEHYVDLAVSLASQAAVSYENNLLYENIQTLFEGFVQASVTAIEQRDPTTSGHSFRVSKLTCGLAEVVDRLDKGPFRDITFTREQMRELRYAAVLHDFGKVGVREEVLVKAKKLYPGQMDILGHRFDYIRKAVEAEILGRKLQAIEKGEPAEALTRLDDELRRRLEEIDDHMAFILASNEPTVMPEGNFDRLIEVAKRNYADPRGVERPYLTPQEVRFLSIPKGSLDNDEREQIESHVIHTFNFLTQIPWTNDLKNVPNIARAHHEKLNGRGYPYNLAAADISPQTRMMTISDIFDALSAADRPYKKAVPPQKALDILGYMVKDGEVDHRLFELFVETKVFHLTSKQ